MRYYAEYKQVVDSDQEEAVFKGVEDSFLHAIVTLRDWAQAPGEEFDALVEAMAQQLPNEDIDRFLDSVRYGFRSRTLDAGLTASLLVQPLGDTGSSRRSVIYLRVRSYIEDPRKEAELPAIGLEVANYLLDALPRMDQTAMMVWQDRDHSPVLVGSVRDRLGFRQVLGANIAATVLAVVAGVLLLSLFLVAVRFDGTPPSDRAQFLGSDWIDWFKRLVGPLSSTLVASLVALGVLLRQGRARSARWLLGDDLRLSP